jgi:hypothetical protein
MPMAPSAVVSGRGVSDVIGASIDLLALAVIALVVGWRSDGSLMAACYAFVLLLLLRFSLIWIGVYLGLLVPNQEAAGNLFAIAFPFGMISSVCGAIGRAGRPDPLPEGRPLPHRHPGTRSGGTSSTSASPSISIAAASPAPSAPAANAGCVPTVTHRIPLARTTRRSTPRRMDASVATTRTDSRARVTAV